MVSGSGLSSLVFISPTDPVNVIFWQYGSSAIVEDMLERDVGGWSRTRIGSMLYALIDDTDHGGSVGWKRLDSQLRKGSWVGQSTHIRIYDGGRRCTHGKNAYSIAGVHDEKFLSIPHPHKPTAWDAARDTLKSDLNSVPNLVNLAQRVNLVPPGSLQGISYDGFAEYLEILVPAWLKTIVSVP